MPTFSDFSAEERPVDPWRVDLILLALAALTLAVGLASGEEFRPTANAYKRSDAGGVISFTPQSGIYVRVTGDEPNPPGPGPGPDPPPTGDRWGLRAAAAAEARAVGDGNGARVAIAFEATAKAVQSGAIPPESLTVMLDLSLRVVVAADVYNAWKPALARLREKFNSAGIETAAEAARGLLDIAAGLRSVDGSTLAGGSPSARDQAAAYLTMTADVTSRAGELFVGYGRDLQNGRVDAAFFDQFLEFIQKILPIILELIKLFGGAN